MTTALDGLIAAVDSRRMAATVTALASDRFTGRRVGTPGSEAARDWLADRLRDLDADIDVEAFAVYAVPDIYAAAQAVWHDGTVPRSLVFGRDVAVHLASADQPGVVRGELGVAGTIDPGGRWLLVPAGMPLSDAYRHADRRIIETAPSAS